MFSHEQLFSAIVAPKGWKSFKKSLKNSANPDLFFSKTILENQYAGCRPCSASFPGWTLRVAEGEKNMDLQLQQHEAVLKQKIFQFFSENLVCHKWQKSIGKATSNELLVNYVNSGIGKKMGRDTHAPFAWEHLE